MNNNYYWIKYWKNNENALNTSDVWWIMDNNKFNHLNKYLKPKSNILDIGCGAGRLSILLTRAGHKVLCTDISHEALIKARNNLIKNCSSEQLENLNGFVNNDLFKISFKEKKFDAVISTGLIEHLENPDEAVKIMTGMLLPGGIFYSDIIPRKFSLMRVFSFLKKNQDDFFERKFSKNDIKNILLKTNKLEILRLFSFGVYPPLQRFHNKTGILKYKWGKFDNTLISDFFGFGYIIIAKKY